jgi:hypothetical protein
MFESLAADLVTSYASRQAAKTTRRNCPREFRPDGEFAAGNEADAAKKAPQATFFQ